MKTIPNRKNLRQWTYIYRIINAGHNFSMTDIDLHQHIVGKYKYDIIQGITYTLESNDKSIKLSATSDCLWQRETLYKLIEDFNNEILNASYS